MKNVFGINYTGVKGGAPRKLDGDCFIDRRIEDELDHRQDEVNKELQEHQKNATLPLWLLIAMYVLLWFGVLCVVEFLIAPLSENRTSYSQAYANAPWVIWAGVPCLFIGLILLIIKWLRAKEVEGSPALAVSMEKAENLLTESYAALGVPEDAKNCDIFGLSYRLNKKGKVRPASMWSAATYANIDTLVFREGDALCIADSSMVLKIPFDRISRLVRVNKRINFAGWNKSTPCNKGEYKQYKIRTNNGGVGFMKSYLSLQLNGDEEFEILFPCYEIETVQSLTGRYAE